MGSQKLRGLLVNNKKGIGSIVIVLVIVLLLVGILIAFDVFTRKNSKADSTPSKPVANTGFFASLKGFFQGWFSYVGYEDIKFLSAYNLSFIIAIAIASILLGVYHWVFIISSFVQKKRNAGSPFNIIYKTALKAFVILLILYFALAFIPVVKLFKPVLLPLFSDYGTKISISYENLIAPIAKFFGKQYQTISPNDWWQYTKLMFMRGFMLSIYICIPFLIYNALPFLIKSYYEKVKRPIEQEEARSGAQDILLGEAVFKAAGRQTRNK